MDSTLLRELSAFSGYCGMTLGLRLAGLQIRTVAYIEKETYCQEIIKARIRDGLLDDGPIYPDIRAFNGLAWRGAVDIFTAGVPCQWISKASGAASGFALSPANLWPHTLRLLAECQPSIVLLENPSNLSRYYYHVIRPGLQELGYQTTERLQSAAEVGAPHIRERLYIIAYSSEGGYRKLFQPLSQPQCIGEADIGSNGTIQYVADSTGKGWTPRGIHPARQITRHGWWATEAGIRRVADGSPHRVDRLEALGNGIVPLQLAYALHKLLRMA